MSCEEGDKEIGVPELLVDDTMSMRIAEEEVDIVGRRAREAEGGMRKAWTCSGVVVDAGMRLITDAGR